MQYPIYRVHFSRNALLFLILIFLSINLSSKEAAQIDDSDSQYHLYFSKGVTLKQQGEFYLAIEFFNKATTEAEKKRHLAKKLDALIHLGIAYWDIGELSLSSKKFAEALNIAQELKNNEKTDFCRSALLIYERYNEAKEFRRTRNISLSIDKFKEAIRLAQKIGSKEHELKCLRQLSLTYWEDSNIQEFFSLNQKALAIARELNHEQEEGRCLNNIGLFYWAIDNYIVALNYFTNALDKTKSTNNLQNEAEYLNNIGILFFTLGSYDKALRYLEKALSIDIQTSNQYGMAFDFINLGETLRRKGLSNDNSDELRSAINFFQKALETSKRINNSNLEIISLNNLGATYSHLRNYHKSLEYFKLAKEKAEHNDESKAMILANLGIVHAQLGNYEESTKYYQMAIDLALEIKGGKILWEAYLELANSYKHQDNLLTALENYKKSISVIENIRSRIDQEELKATFLGSEKKIEAYYNAIDVLVKLNQKEQKDQYKREAFHYLERAKARAFLDSIEVSKINLFEGIDQKLLNREAELVNEISKIHTKLLTPQLSSDQKIEATKDLESYEEQLESLKREIRASSPAYANLHYPRPITLAEAQSKLIDSDAAVFAYVLGKENSYAFVISHKELKIFSLPDYREIHKLVRDYLSALTDVENTDFHLGHTLYNILIKPGLDKKSTQKMIIVPDDILYFLPFETLLIKEKENEWLINKYEVAYVPSLSVLKELISRKKSSGKKFTMDILALGDPFYGEGESIYPEGKKGILGSTLYPNSDYQFFRLKYSGEEVTKISSFFKAQKKDLLTRENASEENLKGKKLSNYRILHLATHALIDDKKPSRSAIVLSLDQDPREDGFLQMREIFNLRLGADLVVLSACQTGLGQLIRGEGIEGLSRAFFYAGASAVLLSLWAINDQASSQLLERFYHHLHSSQPVSAALRKAKIEMINSGTLAHPYFWGAFIVTGETDKIILRRALNKWVILTLSLGASLAILFLWMNREKSQLLHLKK